MPTTTASPSLDVLSVVDQAAGAAQRSDVATVPAFLSSLSASVAFCAACVLVFVIQKGRYPSL